MIAYQSSYGEKASLNLPFMMLQEQLTPSLQGTVDPMRVRHAEVTNEEPQLASTHVIGSYLLLRLTADQKPTPRQTLRSLGASLFLELRDRRQPNRQVLVGAVDWYRASR